MLSTLGRGLAPIAVRPTNNIKKFLFTNSLPEDITFTRSSKATCRNADGKLIEVAIDEARIDHLPDGTPLGLFIEHPSTNKSTNTNINPTTTTGLSTSGTGILSVVSDAAELLTAGLDQICTNNNVIKAEATSGSDFIVTINGTTGNTNAHSIQIHARGEGSGNTASIGLGGTTSDIAPAGNNYAEFKYENIIPASSSSEFTITVKGNQTLYFILNQLEELSECTSIIPISGSAITRPQERARVLNVDQGTWFSGLQGHMICRYRLNKHISGDAYVAAFNSGSSANTIGYRVSSSLRDLKGFVRAGSSNLFSLGNQDSHITKVMNAGGIRWSTSDVEIISGGKSISGTLSSNPSSISQLEIGARNSGNDPMNGHISAIEIGNKDITTAKLGSLLHKSSDQAITAAGQSLARGFFKSQESNSDAGKQKIRELMAQQLKDKAIILVDGSTGGSAASKTSNSTTYWWDLATSTRGPSFDTFYQEINEGGTRPTSILWVQGEEDSHQINIATTRAQYKQALEAIFDDVRQTFGNIPIYIQRIGRRTSFTNIGGVQVIREVQSEMISENDWCHEATEVYDLELLDQVHLTDAAYLIAAERNTLTFLNQPGAYGSSINSASRTSTTITVNVTHDGGTDFTPSSGIEGFKFFDDGTEIAISSAVRTNSNAVTLTLTTPPSSSNQILYYGYDDMETLNTANVIKDNASTPMPLRTAKILIN